MTSRFVGLVFYQSTKFVHKQKLTVISSSINFIEIADSFSKKNAFHLRGDKVSMQLPNSGTCTLTPGLHHICHWLVHFPAFPLVDCFLGNPHSFSHHPPVSS